MGQFLVAEPNAVVWVWWSDSEAANHLTAPPLRPKKYWSWHVSSVHTKRKFLWTISQVLLVSDWGEKGLKWELGVSLWFLSVQSKAAPYCNPPMQPVLNVVPNTWEFEENLFLTDQKGKKKKKILRLFTPSVSSRQSASSGTTAGCGRSPSLVLISVTLLA